MANISEVSKSERFRTENAFKNYIAKRCGEAMIAHDIPDLIRKLPRSQGISASAMVEVLRNMKYQGWIKLKTYTEDHPEIHLPAGSTRIKITSKGKQAFGIRNN